MRVEGRCLCGACEWAAEVDPARVFICHCEDCQVQSSSAFRSSAVIDGDKFELTRGQLRVYLKKAESGRSRALAFCPDCGTAVYGGPPDGVGSMSLRVGPLAQARELKPSGQVWCRSRQGWLDDVNELRGMQTQPGVSE